MPAWRHSYRKALDKLGLTQAGAAEFLGVSIRTSHGYANGEPIPEGYAKLLRLMARLDFKPEVRFAAKGVKHIIPFYSAILANSATASPFAVNRHKNLGFAPCIPRRARCGSHCALRPRSTMPRRSSR